jgi:hypothetical protein
LEPKDCYILKNSDTIHLLDSLLKKKAVVIIDDLFSLVYASYNLNSQLFERSPLLTHLIISILLVLVETHDGAGAHELIQSQQLF